MGRRVRAMAHGIGLSSLALGVVLAFACGTTLPTPDYKAHPPLTAKDIEVPYPPPAARPEIIPPKPREGAVWVDGEWSWQGRQWTWESGGWVIAPLGAYFAPWMTYRAPNGKVLFTPGAWYEENGRS